MKKLFIISLILACSMAGFSQVGITKLGNTVKMSGLTRQNTQLPIQGGVLYISTLNLIGGYSGDIISFKTPGYDVVIPFSTITDKLGTTTVPAYLDKLLGSGLLDMNVSTTTAISAEIDIAGGDTTVVYNPNPGIRPWSVQVIPSASINNTITVTIMVSNDGVNYIQYATELTGTTSGLTDITFAGADISYTYFAVMIAVGSATTGKLKLYTIL
jgi:hypothetical protein